MVHRFARRGLFMVAALLIVSGAAYAQSVVGTTLVDGRKVELLSNQTWRFQSAEVPGCKPISEYVQFCGDRAGWHKAPKLNVEVDATYYHDDLTYGSIISERVGSDLGMSRFLLREAILTNFATDDGIDPSDVVVLSVDDLEHSGLKGETITIQSSGPGVKTILVNSSFVFPEGAVQIVTLHISTELTDEIRERHVHFLNQTKISVAL